MKIPLSWLREYITLDLTPEELAERLTMTGLEVEAIERHCPPCTGVVVGEVLAVSPHPNADKLCIATVSDGTESYAVICGAPNCRQGLKTAFAKVGATLIDDKGKTFTIAPATLRDVESFGMLCSSDELQLSSYSDGIIELPDDATVGSDVTALFSDIVFEIALTPNLGHCASMIGVAREIAALTGLSITYPAFSVEETADDKVEGRAAIVVEDHNKCPRYSCRVITGVTVGPSPLWLGRKLELSGIRSINNIVDATNFVLLEYGHPLHAFDYDKIAGRTIMVKTGTHGETFTTLDGSVRSLPEDALLICDKEKPIALAGIMGGENSEVSDGTTNLLIESAYFDPRNIRRTSKALGLLTESSRRFERGTDPTIVPVVLDRAAALIAELSGGVVTKGIVDAKSSSFENITVSCRFSRINKLPGTQLGLSEIQNIFTKLGLPFTWDGNDTFTISVPRYRHDITSEIDCIEEVARIYGFSNINRKSPSFISSTIADAPISVFEKTVRDRLLQEGLQEFITCDLISPSLSQISIAEGISTEAMVTIVNPTSTEQSILRTSLLPGLLQMVTHNINHGTKDIAGFEIGRIHYKEEANYLEQSCAAAILTGSRYPHYCQNNREEVDFFDSKGLLENLCSALHIHTATFVPSAIQSFHPKRQASLIADKLHIGFIGEVHSSILRKMGIEQRVFFSEINLHYLFKTERMIPQMTELPTFPGSERDWTISVKNEVTFQEMKDMMERNASPLLRKVSIIDVYRGEHDPDGYKNVTFRMLYRDDTMTISANTVETTHRKIVNETLKTLEKKSSVRV